MLFSQEGAWRKVSDPEGLVVSGSLPKEPSPMVQSLPSGLGEPIAVIQESHVDALLPQLSLLLFARPVSLPGYSPFS